MTEIFLTSSVLIAIISILRNFLRGRIDPRLQYTMWLLVAVRLLIPGTLFLVPVSVMGAAEDLPAAVQAVFPDIPSLPQNITAPSGSSLPTPTEAGSPQIPSADSAHSWLDFIWKTGMVVTGGAMLLSNLRFAVTLHRKRRRMTLPPAVETGRLPVYLVEGLPSPCLFGLVRPAIYVNRQSLEPMHLPYILAHERTHFRHMDHIWVLLRGVCLTIHWYNPLVWLAAALSRRDCELACDDGVIWLLGEHRRLDYGNVLLRMVSSGNPSLLRASTSMSAGKRNLKERILMIAQRPRMLKITLAAVVLVMCETVAFTFGGIDKADLNNIPADGDRLRSDIQDEEAPPPNHPKGPDSGHLLSTEYTHFSGLFSLTVPDNWLEDVVYIESEDGTAFYEAESSCWLMTVVPEPVEWAEVYNQTGILLDKFAFNGESDMSEPHAAGGSPYYYMLDWNQEPEYTGEKRAHILSLLEQRETLAKSFRLLADAETFSRLVHDLYESNLPLAISYLPYLSWNNYRTIYSEKEVFSLLDTVWNFAKSGEADWGQYHDILSNCTDKTIDGAYAEAYEGIIWSLYQSSPDNFSTVVDSIYLTESERTHVLYWFRNALRMELDRPEFLDMPDEEIHQLLLDGVPSNR